MGVTGTSGGISTSLSDIQVRSSVVFHLNFVQLPEEFFRFLITVADPAAGCGGGGQET